LVSLSISQPVQVLKGGLWCISFQSLWENISRTN
jgi:hypothetical protein